jgi:sarcosine oxidase subunit gamma
VSAYVLLIRFEKVLSKSEYVALSSLILKEQGSVSNVHLKRVSPLMPDVRKHPLNFSVNSTPNVITECEGYALSVVLERSPLVYGRFKEKFGYDLPSKLGFTQQSLTRAVCVAPGQWLVVRTDGDDAALERELSSGLGETASIFDQTNGRAMFRMSGPRAREALSKGVVLDLHPSVFGPGSAASTSIAYIAVTFWQIDNLPTYELVVFRSFAESLWHWLINAGAEFRFETKFAQF